MPASNYQISSEVVQDIIGQIPPWTIRWGITILFSVFLIILFCSYYIQYPDVLPAQAIISTKEQPFKVSWFRNGSHIHQLYTKEGQEVQIGDTLLIEKSLVNSSIQSIISPLKGQVILLKGTKDNPLKSTIIIYPSLVNFEAQLNLSPKGSGKVHEGQKVLIKLDAFPSEDYGMLEAHITAIIPIPVNGMYQAKLQLAQAFITTENKRIPPQHFMAGNAEIILENRNLFQRVFGSLF